MFSKSKGFTLIEVILVLAIIIAMVVLSIPFYQSFQIRTQLSNTSQEITQTLRYSQSKAMAIEDYSNFGLHFESDKYVLFRGNSYNPTDSYNEVYDLVETLSISVNLNGGGNDIIFDRLKGSTSNYGTVTITSVNNESKIITVNSLGKIE